MTYSPFSESLRRQAAPFIRAFDAPLEPSGMVPPATPILDAYLTTTTLAALTSAALYFVERTYDGRLAVALAANEVRRFLFLVERCDRLERRVERLKALL